MIRYPLTAGHPAGGQVADAVFRLAAGARYVIDRPVEKHYLGTCAESQGDPQCPGVIYGHTGRAEARCDTCGLTWAADGLREALLGRLSDRLLTAAEIAKMSTYLDLPADRERVRKLINQWAKRGRLTRFPAPLEDGTDDGPRFRFAEVHVMLRDMFDTRESA